jgi:hypothetical protein
LLRRVNVKILHGRTRATGCGVLAAALVAGATASTAAVARAASI